ncbi:hypothetical protein M153_4190005305 [Pseudoloma neurophilia]|uniref:Uncharacterized protein n=1 Tax=Pseudoloma neurophilia TaxID=146866 RepID=A0A0R0LXH8_9MICR|nr:hypothetical protein M153_4190005305 [Pseudoloma neurophilia]
MITIGPNDTSVNKNQDTERHQLYQMIKILCKNQVQQTQLVQIIEIKIMSLVKNKIET